LEGAERIILALTAGGFVYVGAVVMMGEIASTRSSFLQTIMQLFAMITGVVLMMGVAHFEHH
jgi:hypothetical protein